ncbi:MAG: hypothetical protein WC831_00495 [Parcubacteria group bacterium]
MSKSNDWARDPRLREMYPKLAEALTEDRREGLRRIRELGLPTAELVTTDLVGFLKDPEMYFSQLPPGKYFVSLDPINPNDPDNKDLIFKRCTQIDITKKQVFEFIGRMVSPEKSRLVEIKLEEYANKFGGTIIIGEKNEIWIEFKEGRQSDIGSGAAAIEYIARQDRHNGIMRYSFDDPELRQAAYNALQAIPHTGERYDTKYNPGYYEFALFEKGGKLKPVFFDYRTSQEFQQKWEIQTDGYPKK